MSDWKTKPLPPKITSGNGTVMVPEGSAIYMAGGAGPWKRVDENSKQDESITCLNCLAFIEGSAEWEDRAITAEKENAELKARLENSKRDEKKPFKLDPTTNGQRPSTRLVEMEVYDKLQKENAQLKADLLKATKLVDDYAHFGYIENYQGLKDMLDDVKEKYETKND